jgi:hypothetical protein
MKDWMKRLTNECADVCRFPVSFLGLGDCSEYHSESVVFDRFLEHFNLDLVRERVHVVGAGAVCHPVLAASTVSPGTTAAAETSRD